MSSFRTSDGLSIAYDVDDLTDPWTTPDTVLMLHSAMASAHRYSAMVPHLSRHFRVVRMDMRGHGRSEIPSSDTPLTMARLVADAAELMDHLKLASAHLVGNSAGGYVSQKLAIEQPQRVKSLSLFGSGAGLKGTDAANWVSQIGKEGLRAFLARTITYRFDPDVDPGCVNWFLDEADKNNVPFLARFVGLMTTLDWTDQLHRIQCPTLLVIPGGDTDSKVRNYDSSLRLIPNIRSIRYDGKRHTVCDAIPDRCARDVLSFLTSLGGSKRAGAEQPPGR
jgi:pimeloyl-ACP methyl ester carboxylesterase